MQKRIWIVGASSGIGLELSQEWLRQGHLVVISARNTTASPMLKQLTQRYPSSLSLIDIDVTDDIASDRGVKAAWKAYGGIDWWFYNAGDYRPMALQEWDVTAFETMNQVNYLGAVRLMNALKPLFEHQGHGRWIFNLSLSAYFGLPYGGGYSAPKAALLNLCESIQPELMCENIEVQVINHGFVQTRLSAKNDFNMPQLMLPKRAAVCIAKALEKPYRFEIRFPFWLALFLRLLRHFPYTLSLRLTRRLLG